MGIAVIPLPEKLKNGTGETDANGCVIWRGPKNHGGYGLINDRKIHHRAHRIAYELARGPIPDGLVLDHLCRNRACVNPNHLEPVTIAENVRRGMPSNWPAKITHCKYGHSLAEGNFYKSGRGKRLCKQCSKRKNDQYQARIKAVRDFRDN